jgi:hypothetical protein
VLVIGCDYELDWDLRHEGGSVAPWFDDRRDEIQVSSEEWRDVVVAVCDAVQQFHDTSSQGPPVDPLDADGVAAFRAEWQRRYARALSHEF